MKLGSALTQQVEAAAPLTTAERDGLVVAQVMDAKTGAMVIVYASESAAEMFGYPRREIERLSLMELMPERFREQHLRGVLSYLKTGVGPVLSKRIEVKGRRKSGSEFPMILVINSLKNTLPTFVATLSDMSDVIVVE